MPSLVSQVTVLKEWGSVSCLDMGLAGGLERAATGVCQLIHFREGCWCPCAVPATRPVGDHPPSLPTAPPVVDRLRVLAFPPARCMHSAE